MSGLFYTCLANTQVYAGSFQPTHPSFKNIHEYEDQNNFVYTNIRSSIFFNKFYYHAERRTNFYLSDLPHNIARSTLKRKS